MRSRRSSLRPALAALVAALSAAGARAQDPFAADVRATPWRTPEEERKALRVPEGFEITCFAHEPDLLKPMNLAFDARGRLWCTSSTEYPYAVKGDREFRGRDRITIHEDRDFDGVAERVTVFADDLNIPIGLYPCVDGDGHDGAIVFSIPNIWRLDDTDGDGRADRREILYGPFGWERDTHGLNNSFRRGFDGWIYACHGYNNRTTVRGRDGHEISMESGNSYRFRLDGSRIEAFTFGQVNPFGSAFDERGDLYTADCHTLPITLLIRGGCYESFGKPHDGLGFTPTIMKHLHGPTALCGLAITTGSQFPAEYADDLFVGNVMSSRVHRDRLEFAGSTPWAVEQPDLVTSDDPWFRPVDLQFGPDGALYVADFYNRIIGHYEVPLDHPGRDRTSGRIWRIAHVGASASRAASRDARGPDLRALDARGLVQELGHPNLTVRMRALDELTDRAARREPAPSVAAALRSVTAERARATALWAAFRLAISLEERATAKEPPPPSDDGQGSRAWRDESAFVRQHALRVIAESAGVPADVRLLATRGLADEDPFVRRATVELLGRHPSAENLRPLFHFLAAIQDGDPILRHATRIALRDNLRDPAVFERLDPAELGPRSRAEVLSLVLALHGEAVGRFLIESARDGSAPQERLAELLEHAAGEAAPGDLPALVEIGQRRFAFDGAAQKRLLERILGGLDRRGLPPDESIARWAGNLARAALAAPEALAPEWRNDPLAGVGRSASPWCLQTRACADGEMAPMLCSLPRGEALTGRLRSPLFELPAKLALFVAGHNGELDRAAIPFNKVRVRAADGRLLAELLPPRNDVAQRFELDLSPHAGAQGFLELVDGNPYDAYAWIAAGRFDLPAVELPARGPAEVEGELLAALRLAARFPDEATLPRLRELATAATADPSVRAGAAAALVARARTPLGAALAALIDDPDAPAVLVDPICAAIADGDAAKLPELAATAVEICPARQQAPLAAALASSPDGAARLLERIAQGKAPGALLQQELVRDRVLAALPGESGDGAARIETLTKGLPAASEARAKLVAERRRSFARHGGDAAAGAALFTKSCALCHQLDGKGAVIGPQLDGIASRGFERLIEDILDPDRNVDVRFQRTNLFLTSGEVLSVLVRRVEGNTIVYADDAGKEMKLQKRDVERERPSRLSAMPSNFDEALSEQDLHDLVAFLMGSAAAR